MIKNHQKWYSGLSNTQIHCDEVPEIPNICYIFEKQGVQGHQKWYSGMSKIQIHRRCDNYSLFRLTRRSLILGRFLVYQRSDWCSRTMWAPRMLEKIWRCSSYYFIYNFSKTRCSNGVDCRIFKWISPFEDRKYLSKNKSLWTKVTNLTIHINENHGVLLKL